MSPKSLLGELQELRNRRDQSSSERKLSLLCSLHKRRFSEAEDLHRFHDLLCFLRAYPDNSEILEQVESCLAHFSSRSDLRRHRNQLASSGIAGTPIDYRFFYPMAQWLAKKWGKYLHIDWPELDKPDSLLAIIPLLATAAESSQFDDFDFSPRQWLQRLKKADETDAEFLIKRIGALYSNSFEREALHDGLDLPFRLLPGPDTPTITHASYPARVLTYVNSKHRPGRPKLRQVIPDHPVAVRRVDATEGEKLIDLARTAMVTHERDIDAFSYGSKHDVRLVDCGDGLQFVCIGTVPERRYLLPGLYGFLNLKNGVPTGYFQVSVLFDTAEVSFNTFAAFRGNDAATVYARALAMTHHLFKVRTFALDSYQLGYGNHEGLQSGVWWFYYKLGFRPLDPRIRALARSEVALMKRRPGHRSSLQTLKRLAADYMFFELEPGRSKLALMPLSWNIAPGISSYLAGRFGAEREKGLRTCSREAAARLGLKQVPRLNQDERLAWERWAPLLLKLPGLQRWSRQGRDSVVRIIRAKGGQRESDYIEMMARHQPLQRAIVKFASGVQP